MTPSASIILPLLRQVDVWLDRAVRSALLQTVTPEVLVVTSPSTPESNRRILAGLQAEFPELRVIEREPHMRFAAALNLGIRTCRANRIGFLLTDDWLEPTAVELCLPSRADVVSTDRSVYAADGVTVLPQLTWEHSRKAYDKIIPIYDRASYLGYFFLFQRPALDAVGGLDETLGDSPGIDDLDMIWSMLERGASVDVIEGKLYNIRDHAGERLTTRNRDEMMATFIRIIEKHGVTPAEREYLLREHSPWFGRPILEVYEEQRAAELDANRKTALLRFRVWIAMLLSKIRPSDRGLPRG